MRLWAYALVNNNNIYIIDNQPLFLLIKECGLCEDNVYIDEVGGIRTELRKLFGVIEKGDTVMVRSLVDLADTGKDLVNVLNELQSKGVGVVSVAQRWYDGKQNLNQVEDVINIITEFSEKKRKLGMEKARKKGRMGRRPMKHRAAIEEQVKLLHLQQADVESTTEMFGISRSTYYRMVKSKDKNEDFSQFGK